MKKINAIIASAALLSMLTGCKDAEAEISDRETILFKVGSTTVTKGTVYDMLMNSQAGDTVLNGAQKKIAEQEIEITDEIKADAQETLDMYLEYYGDSFTTYLDQLGMTSEDYLNKSLIPSIQVEKLSEKYVDENFDTLAAKYQPVKAILIEFTTKEDSDAAFAELNEGKDPAETASAHNSYSSGTSMIYTTEAASVDASVRTALLSQTPDQGWTQMEAADGSAFYIIKVEDNNVENFRDDAVSNFRTLADVSTASTQYWLSKYNFHVYDITAYNALKEDHPEYLIQDGIPAEETETDTETEAATE